MCGIVGFMNTKDNKLDLVKKMNVKISHRGPDGEGYYVDSNIAIGHRRLAIIDVDGGKQPMENACLVVAFNGEVYNYQELKKELENRQYTFKTNSDTEVLLYGFQEWREDLPQKLRGMFAFVIWDKINKALFVCRDYFGIKPIYYYSNKNTFMFASEIKSLLVHPDFEKILNKDLIGPYLSFGFSPGSETFFKGVYALEPGTYLMIKNNVVIKKRYFEMNFQEKEIEAEELFDNLNEVIKKSVEIHKISDVEIGSFLSSGIDSSYITSILLPNKTYTIGYNEKKYSEVNYAVDLSNKLRINNYSMMVTKEDYFQILPKIMYHIEEPTSDPSIISLYYLAKLACQDVKVVLSGEGADEFFGGYNTYSEEFKYCWYYKLPKFLRYALAVIVKKLPNFKGKYFLMRNGLSIEEEYVGVSKIFWENERKKYLNVSDKIKNKDITKNVLEQFQNANNLNKKQAVDINFWLVKDILLKVDKMTMANSLEARTPFIDKEVYAFAKTIPLCYKVDKKRTKIALREAAKKVIPNKAYQKKKLGFPVPLNDWLKEDDIYLQVKETFEKRYVSFLFKRKYILKLLEQHKKGKQNNYKKIWSIYSFLIWYEVFFLGNEESI